MHIISVQNIIYAGALLRKDRSSTPLRNSEKSKIKNKATQPNRSFQDSWLLAASQPSRRPASIPPRNSNKYNILSKATEPNRSFQDSQPLAASRLSRKPASNPRWGIQQSFQYFNNFTERVILRVHFLKNMHNSSTRPRAALLTTIQKTVGRKFAETTQIKQKIRFCAYFTIFVCFII